MAFTAKIDSVNFQTDTFRVQVTFLDDASGWTNIKTYAFPSGTTQAQAQAQITSDGTTYKANIALNTTLQSKVGTVITI